MSCAARRVGIEVNVLVGVVQEATSWTTRPVVAPRACAGGIATQLARCRIHALSGRKGILACLQVVDGTAATGAAVRTKLTVLVLRGRSRCGNGGVCRLPASEPGQALGRNTRIWIGVVGSGVFAVQEALHTHRRHIAIGVEQGDLARTSTRGVGGDAGLRACGGIVRHRDRMLVGRATIAVAAGCGVAANIGELRGERLRPRRGGR